MIELTPRDALIGTPDGHETHARMPLADLERVRESGHAVDLAECLPGVHCVAAPIFDEHGYPVAAVHVTGPSDRLSRQTIPKMAAQVRACAEQISRKLGSGFTDESHPFSGLQLE